MKSCARCSAAWHGSTKCGEDPECRFTKPNGAYCRKPADHRRHQQHDANCNVPRKEHHDFVPPRPYGQDVREARVYLLAANYEHAVANGGISACINRLLTIDRGAAGRPLRITSIEDAEPKRTKRKRT